MKKFLPLAKEHKFPSDLSYPVCVLIDGINNFDTFSCMLSDPSISNPISIEITNNLFLICINCSMEYFNSRVKSKINLFNYEIFTIFSKKSKLISAIHNLDRNLFYIYYENSNITLLNRIKGNNEQDFIISKSSSKKCFHGFSNFSNSVEFYIELIKNHKYWPVYAVYPSASQSIKNNRKQIIKNNKKLARSSEFPLFSPIKSLFYINFIESEIQNPKKVANMNELFSIKNIPDVQISHLFINGTETSIRTFLGFENKFRCLHVFDFLNQNYLNQNDEKFLIDISLLNDINDHKINIKSNLFYIEIQSLPEISIVFSLNYIDSFNFLNDNSINSIFFGFDNFDDLLFSKKILKQLIFKNNNECVIKDIKSIENDDFQLLFPDLKKSDNLFYLTFRLKYLSKSSRINISSLLKNSTLVKYDAVCSLNNKKYVVVGYDNNMKRDEAMVQLKKSKYSIKLKCYLPSNFNKVILPTTETEREIKEITTNLNQNEKDDSQNSMNNNNSIQNNGSNKKSKFHYNYENIIHNDVNKDLQIKNTVYPSIAKKDVNFDNKTIPTTNNSAEIKINDNNNNSTEINNNNNNVINNNFLNTKNSTKKSKTKKQSKFHYNFSSNDENETSNNNKILFFNDKQNEIAEIKGTDDNNSIKIPSINNINDEIPSNDNSNNKIITNINTNQTLPNIDVNKKVISNINFNNKISSNNNIQPLNNSDNDKIPSNEISNNKISTNINTKKIPSNDNIQLNNDVNTKITSNYNFNNNISTNIDVNKLHTNDNSRKVNQSDNSFNNKISSNNNIPSNSNFNNNISANTDVNKLPLNNNKSSNVNSNKVNQSNDNSNIKIPSNNNNSINKNTSKNKNTKPNNNTKNDKSVVHNTKVSPNNLNENNQNQKRVENEVQISNDTRILPYYDYQINRNHENNIKNYKIIDIIGNGSFGCVYKVEEISTGKIYAAKECIRKSNLSSFTREIDFYLKMDNPTILSLHDYSNQNFKNEKFPTLILDYMPNGSLSDAIKRSKKDSNFNKIFRSKKYIILIGIVIGMNYLHSKGIIHRDIKPENILLDENLCPKICDFGLSIISDHELLKKQRNSTVGTAYYMAPEICFGENPYSYSIDVYAFAILAYELLTGNEPYTNVKKAKILLKEVENGRRPDLSIINNPAICVFFERCWSRDPNERPDFKEIFHIIYSNNFMMAFEMDKIELSSYFKFEIKGMKLSDKLCLKTAADCGNIHSMVEYGNMLCFGIKCKKNTKEGMNYLRKAANLGSIDATYFIGIVLRDSENSNDQRRANHYLKIAADNGHEKAMIDYATNLILGKNKDYYEAKKYYEMAIKLGDDEAMYAYGKNFEQGRGVKKDIEKALFYFEMAADKGNVNAMYEIAYIYSNVNEIQHDYKKAEKYYKLAAYLGDSDSMLNLGIMLKDGRLETDLEESEKYLRKAIKLNNDKAMYTLAHMLWDRANETKILGEKENLIEEATKLFKKAAYMGNESASIYLRRINEDPSDNEPPINTNFLGGYIETLEKILFLAELGFDVSDIAEPYLLYEILHGSNISSRNSYDKYDDYNDNKIEIIKDIKEIKPNIYESFKYETDNFFCLSHSSFTKELLDRIKEGIKSLTEYNGYKENICFPRDPNNLYTFFFFSDMEITPTNIIVYIMKKFQIESKIQTTQDYLYFDENMIPEKELSLLMAHVSLYKEIVSIDHDVFDGSQMCTFLNVKKGTHKIVIQKIRDLLLQKDIIFNSSKYQIENCIIINEKMILKDEIDFNTIVNEIKSQNIKIESILPNKLYLYNNYLVHKLFQIFSFIIFRNERDKMRALNHINKILYDGMNNILKYKEDLHYCSINDFVYQKKIRDLIPSILDGIKGINDIQSHVLSIESPVERTYIGFDTINHLIKGYHKFMHKIKICLNCEKPKLFIKKKDVKHYLAIRVNHSKIFDDVIKEISISSSALDVQEYCTEYIGNGLMYNVTYLGFGSLGDLIDAEKKFKNDDYVKKENTFATIFHEGKTFMNYSSDIKKESYLFYDSF